MAVTRNSLSLQWHGFYGDENLLSQFSKTLNDILNQKKGSHFESLCVGKEELYSARVNPKEGDPLSDRLLLTTLVVDGKRCLFLLGHITKHRYHRSEFVKNPKAIKRHLAQHSHINLPISSMDIRENPSIEIENANEIDTDLEFTKKTMHHLHFHQGQIIIFNSEQQRAFEINKFPLLISGRAGSGKTAIIESLLPQLAEMAYNEKRQVAVLTKSKELCRNNQIDWKRSPLYQEKYEETVLFFTDETLITFLNIEEVRGCKFSQKQESLNWIYKQSKRKIDSIRSIFDYFNKINKNKACDYIYQEFRIYSAYMYDISKYLALGNNQSIISKDYPKIRHYLANLYHEYFLYLQSNNLLDTSFVQLPSNQYFHSMAIDEGLDLSLFQQDSYYKITERLIISHDPQQRLFDDISSRQQFIAMLSDKYSVTPQLIQLPYSYRSAKRIVTFLQAIKQIENNLSGGIADKYDHASIEGDPNESREGSVTWLIKDNKKLSSDQSNKLSKLAASHECAFIIYEGSDDIETASKKQIIQETYGAKIILTAEEAKGLGFKYIVLCDLISPDRFAEANAETDISSLKTHPNKPKDTVFGHTFTLALNRLGVAAGRAIEHLYIIHTPCYKTERIVLILQNYPNLNVFTSIIESKQDADLPEPSTEKEWTNQEENLLNYGITIRKTAANSTSLRKTTTQDNKNKKNVIKEKVKQAATYKKISDFFDISHNTGIGKISKNVYFIKSIDTFTNIIDLYEMNEDVKTLLITKLSLIFTLHNQKELHHFILYILSSVECNSNSGKNIYLEILEKVFQRLVENYKNTNIDIVYNFINAAFNPLLQGEEKDKSALWWMCSDKEALSLVEQMVHFILNIFNIKSESSIVIKFLISLFRIEASEQQTQSPIWWLSNTKKGQNILLLLLPLLAHMLSSRKEKFILLSNDFIQCFFAFHVKTLSILNKLILNSHYDEILLKIFPAIIQHLSIKYSDTEKRNAFFFNSLFPENKENHILYYLSGEENLFQPILPTLLTFIEKILADKKDVIHYSYGNRVLNSLNFVDNKNTSALWMMIGQASAPYLLGSLLNIILIKDIDENMESNRFVSYIFPVLSIISEENDVSVIRLLSESEIFRDVLRKIFPYLMKYLHKLNEENIILFLQAWLINPIFDDADDLSALAYLVEGGNDWEMISILTPIIEKYCATNQELLDDYIYFLSKDDFILGISNNSHLYILLNYFSEQNKIDYLLSKKHTSDAVKQYITDFFVLNQKTSSSTISIFSHHYQPQASSSSQQLSENNKPPLP